MVSKSRSPLSAALRLKRRPPSQINFSAVSQPAESLSSDGDDNVDDRDGIDDDDDGDDRDDATSAGFSLSTEAILAQGGMDMFDLQDPSAPPLSRGTSTMSWTQRHRRKRSDSASSLDVVGGGQRGATLQQQQQERMATKPLPPPKHGRPRLFPNDISIYPLGRQQYAGQGTDGGARHIIKLHRPIMSRRCGDTLRVLETIDPPDIDVNQMGGCCGLCRAPSKLPCLAAVLPCCAYPEGLETARRESSYLIIRDNSVEYNDPKVVVGSRILPARRVASASAAHRKNNAIDNNNAKHYNHHHHHHHDEDDGQHRGACGITHHVRDDARVFYFDDPVFEDVTAITGGRWGGLAAELRHFFCGGRGQAVRLQSRVCCGACVRTRGLAGLPCLPACCVCLCQSAALRYDIPAKDAVTAAAKIRQARHNALAKMSAESDARAAVPYVLAKVKEEAEARAAAELAEAKAQAAAEKAEAKAQAAAEKAETKAQAAAQKAEAKAQAAAKRAEAKAQAAGKRAGAKAQAAAEQEEGEDDAQAAAEEAKGDDAQAAAERAEADEAQAAAERAEVLASATTTGRRARRKKKR